MRPSQGKKTLLLDIGNVIMHFDFSRVRVRLAERSEAKGDPLELLAPLKRRLEIGAIDGVAFVEEAIATLGYRGGADRFRGAWEDIFSPNDAMWQTIRKARESYRLYLLSDTSDIHQHSLFRDFEIFQCFDGGVYSYRAHCAKPDPGFYRTAIEELELVPAETLYVDDRAENVDAGARAGMPSVQYDAGRHDRFLQEARDRGFPL